MSLPVAKPHVVIVGGPDVDARLELMRCLSDAFDVAALGSDQALQPKFDAEGFDYRAYHMARGADPLSDLCTVFQLAVLFRRLRPHIVHAFDKKPTVCGCLAARLACVPVIINTVTGLGSLYASDTTVVKVTRAFYQTFQRLISSISQQTIFQNRDDLLQFLRDGVVSSSKVSIILGSGVATNVFAQSRVTDQERAQLKVELGIERCEIVVTMVSRVMRTKGVFEFAEAARMVRQSHPHARFLLIGAHDDESIDRLSTEEVSYLKRGVTWPGARRDIEKVLAISDVFVFPSAYREGIPRVLLEAASMELPIVTTDSPGCNEVVEDGVNGFLVPVRDSAALSRVILSLVEQPELRRQFGQSSRHLVLERFDLSVVARETRSMYLDLLAHRGIMPATA